MYQPLVLAKAKEHKARKRKYEYKLIDDRTAVIRIPVKDDVIETIVDIETLERIKGNVIYLYAWRNKAGKPYINLRLEGSRQFVSLSRYITSAPEGMVVDHKNGDTLDNRLENLRVVDKRTNMRNRKRWNKTGKRGVYKVRKPDGTVVYEARLMVGAFATIEEAERAYQEAYKQLFPDALIQE